MLWDGKSGLTEAVVTSPSWAFLFYGRWSLGEGLSLGKAWDAMFTLSGAISWVGKQAQLNVNVGSLGEGWQLIAQAFTECCSEPRGPRHPCLILPASSPFSFYNEGKSLWGVRLPTAAEWLEVPRHNHWASYHEKGQILQCSWDHSHRWWDLWATLPCHLCLHWIAGSRLTKAQCQPLHQCHQDLTDLEVQGVDIEADATGSPEVMGKSMWPSSRMKTLSTLSPIKAASGI